MFNSYRLLPGFAVAALDVYRVRTELVRMRLGNCSGYERSEAVNDLHGTNDRL